MKKHNSFLKVLHNEYHMFCNALRIGYAKIPGDLCAFSAKILYLANSDF